MHICTTISCNPSDRSASKFWPNITQTLPCWLKRKKQSPVSLLSLCCFYSLCQTGTYFIFWLIDGFYESRHHHKYWGITFRCGSRYEYHDSHLIYPNNILVFTDLTYTYFFPWFTACVKSQFSQLGFLYIYKLSMKNQKTLVKD